MKEIQVELVSHWGDDRNIAEAAWASSTDKSKLSAKTQADVMRVVKSVVSLHHSTPLERVWMDFFITMPIFCERQFDKYRLTYQFQDFRVEFLEADFGRHGITQNELSGRYRTIPDRPFSLPLDVARISAKATGSLSKSILGDQHTPDYEADIQELQEEFLREQQLQHEFYNSQLTLLKAAERRGDISNAEYKRAREVYRGILGTSFLTDMRLVMNLNAFEHIINQRLARDAQFESRVVAAKMLKAVEAQGVAAEAVSQMKTANGWLPLVEELEGAI